MLLSFCKKFLQINAKHPTHVHFLHNPFPKSISDHNRCFRSISNLSDSTNEPSITLSYLINSCGLSPESALSASRAINLKTTHKPDTVLEFFKSHGFTDTQIANLICVRPRFLLANVETTLIPKLKFFQDLGLSKSEIDKLIASSPSILLRGLKSQLIPSIDFLRNLVHTNENVARALRRWRWMITSNLEKRMQPNIALLEEYGVPASRMTYIIMHQPRILSQKTESLRDVLERVEEFGFERGSGMYVVAIHALYSMKKSLWEAKFKLFKSLGWSENEIRGAFRRMPLFMTCSQKKIRTVMDFVVKKLKWGPTKVAHYPILLMFSLEKRLIPRSKVWEILKYKELVKERELKQMLKLPEHEFLRRYIIKYEKEVPNLLKTYSGELEF